MMTAQGSIIEALREAMEKAAAEGDFEAAAILRDRISLLRGASPGLVPADIDPTGLVRQQPGAMGLGTNLQRMTPPEGWVRPKKPSPMTNVQSRRGKGRKLGD